MVRRRNRRRTSDDDEEQPEIDEGQPGIRPGRASGAAATGTRRRNSRLQEPTTEEQQPPAPQCRSNRGRWGLQQKDSGQGYANMADAAVNEEALASGEKASANQDDSSSSDASFPIPDRPFQCRDGAIYDKRNKKAIEKVTQALGRAQVSRGSSGSDNASSETGTAETDIETAEADRRVRVDRAVRMAQEVEAHGPECSTCLKIVGGGKFCGNPVRRKGTIMCEEHKHLEPERRTGESNLDDKEEEGASDCAMESRAASCSQQSRGTLMSHETLRSNLKSSKKSRNASQASLGTSQKSVSIQDARRNRRERSSNASSDMHRSKESMRSLAGSGRFPGSSHSANSKYAYKSYTKGGSEPSQFAAYKQKIIFSSVGSSTMASLESTRDDKDIPPPSCRERADDEGQELASVTSFHPPAEVSPESLEPMKRKRDDLDEDDDLSMQGLEEKRPRGLRMDEEEDDPEKHDEAIQDAVVSDPLKPPEAGIIIKINVKNFMNHRNMTVDLCPNINFIHGQNGSGKSAILVALQVALGARAHSTQRAKNAADLIRKVDTRDGEPPIRQAIVRVTFKNAGVDAFQPDVYGHEITIEKIINRSGPNELHLRDHNGKVQSSSTADLVDILDKWNTHVDNPVTILTQEDAKNFLKGSDKTKYEFFKGATELGRLSREYEEARNCLNDLQNEVERLASSFEEDRKAKNNAKREYSQYKTVGELERRKGEVSEGLAWAEYKAYVESTVEKTEAALEEAAVRLRAEKESLNALEQAALKVADDETSLSEKLEALKAQKKESLSETRHTKIIKKEEKSQLNRLKIDINKLRREMKDIRGDLNDARRVLREKHDAIARWGGYAQVEKRDRILKREKTQQCLDEAKEDLQEVQRSIKALQCQKDNKEIEVKDAKTQLSEGKAELDRCNENVASLQKSAGNSLAVFGSNCSTIKDRVESYTRQGRFLDEVIGPIGSHCRIHRGKEALGALAQTALGPGMLDRFIVFNNHDRKVFHELRASLVVRFQCGVIQMNHHSRYNISNPPDGVETVASVFQVTNDDVFNCLVDFCKIEEKALFHYKEESERQLLRRQPDRSYAMAERQIKSVWFLPKGDNWKINGGNLTLTATRKISRLTLGVDVGDALRDAETERQDAVDFFQEKDKEVETLQNQLNSIKTELKESKSESRHLSQSVRQAAVEIEELDREDNEAEADQDLDTSEEEAAVENCKEQWSKKDARCTLILERYGDKMTAITEKEKDMAEEEFRRAQLVKDLESLEEQMEKCSQRNNDIMSLRVRIAEIEDEVQQRMEKLHTERDEAGRKRLNAKKLAAKHRRAQALRNRRENGIARAPEDIESILSDNMETPDLDELGSIDYYKSRIETIQESINEEMSKIKRGKAEDIVSAYEKYMRAKTLYKSKIAKSNELKRLCQALKEDVGLRESRWLMFREYISILVGLKFSKTLALKDSSGCLLFNHEKETLRPTFVPDYGNEMDKGRQVATLSGGERSLSTIALLLALGETTENPFRAMDEFDVFLDAVTRKVIIDNLIKIGKQMSNRQFIFLTPQDISDVDADDMVKIFRLPNPSRRRRRIGTNTE